MWGWLQAIVGGAVGATWDSILRRFFPPKTAADQEVADDEKTIDVQADQLKAANKPSDTITRLKSHDF